MWGTDTLAGTPKAALAVERAGATAWLPARDHALDIRDFAVEALGYWQRMECDTAEAFCGSMAYPIFVSGDALRGLGGTAACALNVIGVRAARQHHRLGADASATRLLVPV